MSVACFAQANWFAVCLPQVSMSQMYNVGISTLHGNIIHIEVEAHTLVRAFKQQCMDESQLDVPTPLVSAMKVNVDVAHLMRSSGPAQNEWEGVRLAHWSGNFLDDHKTMGSQVTLWQTDLFMFKLVFFKQTNLSHRDNAMIADFVDHGKDTSGYIVSLPHNDTQFVVMPLWGGVDRPDDILGVIYQHKATEEHCSLMLRGVDPRWVDTKFNALKVDFEVVKPSP